MNDSSFPTCIICLRSLIRTKIGVPGSCKHEFCYACILEWSKNINTCPVDRSKFGHILVYRNGRLVDKTPVEDREFNEFSLLTDEEYNVVCEVCGLSDREDRLLLCDSCDLGYHLECLTPPLHHVPEGNWFCPVCAPTLDHGPGPSHSSVDGYDGFLHDSMIDGESSGRCLRPRTGGISYREGPNTESPVYFLRSRAAMPSDEVSDHIDLCVWSEDGDSGDSSDGGGGDDDDSLVIVGRTRRSRHVLSSDSSSNDSSSSEDDDVIGRTRWKGKGKQCLTSDSGESWESGAAGDGEWGGLGDRTTGDTGSMQSRSSNDLSHSQFNRSGLSIHSGFGEADTMSSSYKEDVPSVSESKPTYVRSKPKRVSAAHNKRRKLTMRRKHRAKRRPKKEKVKKCQRICMPTNKKRLTRVSLPSNLRPPRTHPPASSTSDSSLVCIPDTPSPKHSRTTPTCARLASNTPKTTLRQMQVREAVQNFQRTGALEASKWEPLPRRLTDRHIEDMVQTRAKQHKLEHWASLSNNHSSSQPSHINASPIFTSPIKTPPSSPGPSRWQTRKVSSKEKLRSGHVTSPLDSIMKEMDKIANAKDVCLTKQGQLL